ncbi:AAA family ATPase [Luteimonas sp. BDR2-5]|uniref:AAA family ATPase n=1 Tax=Proluteimonas luteida TaxID=2878685 RepID=UPI001E3EFD5B|nr:AAA family ATPase [Luteimonas sp. BDR2-5]MCD9027207.1 AAA family ATPase [Luteimonas sp. BDR2-5]
MPRPVLYVLAGVNGAGKSSVGGHLLERAGLTWFNPDDFARGLVARTGCSITEANAAAWQAGMQRLDAALAAGHSHAFETTLGGNSVPARIAAAAATHDVLVWFCGLSSPAQHIARVRARVAAGGHDIPEAAIRARWTRSRENLVALMPRLARLQVYDNSRSVAPGDPVPDPVLLLDMRQGRPSWPDAHDLDALRATPDWARPLLEAAFGV